MFCLCTYSLSNSVLESEVSLFCQFYFRLSVLLQQYEVEILTEYHVPMYNYVSSMYTYMYTSMSTSTKGCKKCKY